LKVNRIAGMVVPTASLLILFLLSYGIAASYVLSLSPVAALMVSTTVVVSAIGTGVAVLKRERVVSSQRWISGVYALGLVFVLATMLVSVPDAVSGVVPSSPDSLPTFAMGTPVYAGAYMDAPPGHALGVGVTVSFASTNTSAIQADNFLSGGMGVHAAGCCVDGIDYSYRFDVYLFHGGGESLSASAWEVCDDNAACGGHSWKSLMFLHTETLNGSVSGKNITLRVFWSPGPAGDVVEWSYSLADGPSTELTSFQAPPAENKDFNTGVLDGGTLGPQQTGSYFFQFGMMSRYPIGHAGWRVELDCPSVLTSGWRCVDHVKTLAGDQSFWKVFWRWGEDYSEVSTSAFDSRSIVFGFAPNSAQSFQSLW